MRLRLIRVLGWIANIAGLPGFVRECDYRAESSPASVRVRYSSLYTVITVNGVDAYFYRITGGIDGIGMEQREESIPQTPEAAAE